MVISSPIITVRPTYGSATTQIEIVGNNYTPNNNIIIEFELSLETFAQVATTVTNSDGIFKTIFSLPFSSSGHHIVRATDSNSLTAQTIVTVLEKPQEYYSRLLYSRLPEIYRTKDKNRYLEKFLMTIGEQAGNIREDIDKLWYNFFIDTCEDWAIPYIGSLIGANLLSDDPIRNRIDVRNTIGWRKSKGTIKTIQEVASFTSGWGTRTREFFENLVWCQNINHIKPNNLATPDLRNMLLLERLNSGLDQACYIPDIRNPSQPFGKYNIKNVGFFLSRLKIYPVTKSEPYAHDNDSRFHFEPMERDSQLYDGSTGERIGVQEFALEPYGYFATDKGMKVYINGILAAADKPTTTTTTTTTTTPSTSQPSKLLEGFSNLLNESKGMGIWLIEPRTFQGRRKQFEITGILKSPDEPLLELGILNTGDNSYNTLNDNSTKTGAFLLKINIGSGSESVMFPKTIIAIRNNNITTTSADSKESRFSNALYVYLPEVYIGVGEKIYFYVAEDGSSYFANSSPSRIGDPNIDPDPTLVLQRQNLAERALGQIYPARVLTNSQTPLSGFLKLNRHLSGIKVPDISKYEGKAFMIEIFRFSIQERAFDEKLKLLAKMEVGSLAPNQYIYQYFDSYDEGALLFAITKLQESPDPVFPISEIILTNSSSNSVLIYLPEIDVSNKRYIFPAEDGSTYSAEEDDGSDRILQANRAPGGAFRSTKLLRKSAGQVSLMTKTIPMRQRTPVYLDLSRWNEKDFGPFSGELAIDPLFGRFMFAEGDQDEPNGRVNVDYNYAFPDDIGAGSYDRFSSLRDNIPPTKWVTKTGDVPDRNADKDNIFTDLQEALSKDRIKDGDIIQISDSSTYVGDFVLDSDSKLEKGITIQAANRQRPTLRSNTTDVAFKINADITSIELNGLNIEASIEIENEKASLQHLILQSCRINPTKVAFDLKKVSPMTSIMMNQCIIGSVRSNEGISALTVNRSIIHSPHDENAVVGKSDVQAKPKAIIERSTIMGKCYFSQLYASEVIFNDTIMVEDQQEGCFRYSRYEVGSVLPRKFKSTTLKPLFNSENPFLPWYLQLHLISPPQIYEGGEYGYEMGCYYYVSTGLIAKRLGRKIEEYLPVGLVPVLNYMS